MNNYEIYNTKEYREFHEILHYGESGKERRNAIKQFFLSHPDFELLVDCSHTRQVKKDSDLKALIKRGFLKRTRVSDGIHCNKTHLIMVK
jgi:hypothetical protein